MVANNDFLNGLELDYECFEIYRAEGNDIAAAYHIGRCKKAIALLMQFSITGCSIYALLAQDERAQQLFKKIIESDSYTPIVGYRR